MKEVEREEMTREILSSLLLSHHSLLDRLITSGKTIEASLKRFKKSSR
jgi:hypothetical protein